jgi:hypothetical protein
VVRSFCSCKKSYRLSQSSSSRECEAAGSQDGGSSDGGASSSNALHLAVLSGLEAVLVQLLRAPGVDVNFRWVQASVRGAGELLLHAAKGGIWGCAEPPLAPLHPPTHTHLPTHTPTHLLTSLLTDPLPPQYLHHTCSLFGQLAFQQADHFGKSSA